MEELDDMIRDSINKNHPESRYEFKEEYWLMAKELLEANERRRRLWIFFVPLALSLAGGIAWWFWPTDAPPGISPETGPSPALEQKELTPVRPMAQIGSGQSAVSSQQSTADSGFSAAGSEMAPAANSVAATSSSAKTTTPRSISPTQLADISLLNSISTTETTITGVSNTSIIAAPGQENAIPATTGAGRAKVALANNIPSLAILLPTSTSNKTWILNSSPAEKTPITTKVAERRKWAMGAYLGTGSTLGIFSKEKLPLIAGISAQYSIHRKWAINTDLLWHRISGAAPAAENLFSQYDAIAATTDIQYSFGYFQNRNEVSTQTLHSLEIPIYVSRQTGRFSAFAGPSLFIPLTLKKTTTQYHSESLSPTETRIGSDIAYVSPNGISRINIGAILGFGVQILPQLNLTARGTLMSLKSENMLAPTHNSADLPSSTLSRFSAQLGLRLLL